MSHEVRLRDVEQSDLEVLYEHQLDDDATRMAGFPARDRDAFDAHWATKVLGNPAVAKQTILLDGQVAGHIGSWHQDGVRLVGYWIGKEHWGKGVASRALAAFLELVTERPLHAHVAKHNVGSIRVLEKCGFTLEHEESVEVDGEGVAELVLVLHPIVLFVCEHGSAKSVVAAAHFNRLATERGLHVRALSRGTAPDAEMAPGAVAGLRGDGLAPSDSVPRQLAQAALQAAERVVTFCDLPPALFSKATVQRWEVPPVSTDYPASRDAILTGIAKLLDELADKK